MNKNTIILLSAKIGAGKDTVAKMIDEELRSTDNVVHHEKFASFLKEICSNDFKPLLDELNDIFAKNGLHELITKPENFFDNKTLISRMLLQLVGSELIRKRVDEDFWVKHLAYEISQKLFGNMSRNNVVVISDWRFRNELSVIDYINRYRINYPDVEVKLVRIIRPNETNDNVGKHSSEVDLDDFNGFNYRINNFGSLNTLRSKVRIMLAEFGLL